MATYTLPELTQPEPVGTYFSSNDFVPRGGDKVFLGFGAFSDQGVDFRPLGGTLISDFQSVPRGPTLDPDDQGQYGLSLRWFLPNFASGTEFGLYYVNYHSKLPLISGRTGTQTGVGNALGTLTAFVLLLQRAFALLAALGEQWQTVQGALAGVERVFEVLAVPSDPTGRRLVGLPVLDAIVLGYTHLEISCSKLPKLDESCRRAITRPRSPDCVRSCSMRSSSSARRRSP